MDGVEITCALGGALRTAGASVEATDGVPQPDDVSEGVVQAVASLSAALGRSILEELPSSGASRATGRTACDRNGLDAAWARQAIVAAAQGVLEVAGKVDSASLLEPGQDAVDGVEGALQRYVEATTAADHEVVIEAARAVRDLAGNRASH